MNKLLDEILSVNQVTDEKGFSHSLHSHTGRQQCEFLQKIIEDIKPSYSLEVGFAYGISTLAILEALDKLNEPFHHIVIDPYQDSWKDIGLLNVERAGFSDKITFHRKFSDQVIPTLYNENHRIQFAYIDSTKVFDVVMTDVYFINKILDINGVLVLDDCEFPGIRALVRFLRQHPSYEIYSTHSKDNTSKKLKFLRRAYFFCLDLIPFKSKVFPNYNFTKDEQLGVNFNCIAFRKIREDDRSWDWHTGF
ncbi:MAG TPA: class I SAM-dependent methyltransferase [Cytophagaceae bacterium]|nr:class I SAM-dependent methyltransferase [Cytophagaceae bacterium]